MNVNLAKHERTADSHLFELTCGKQSAHVWVSPFHVMVCNLNASHRAWGGLGKRFDNIEQAFTGYKSSAMRAMLQAVANALRVPA